jgi:hypothetical protein
MRACALAPIGLLLSLTLAHAQDTAPASKADSAAQLSKTEIQPLMGARLPAGTAWSAITAADKWKLILKQDFASPVTVTRPALGTFAASLAHDSKLWPRTLGGTARLYGSYWVAGTVQDLVETAGNTLTGQEIRYVSCPCTGGWRRARHAVLQSFMAYDRNGKWSFGLPRVAGYYASSAVVVYGLYPTTAQTPGKLLYLGTSQIYFGAAADLFQEFVPEITRFFRRKTR